MIFSGIAGSKGIAIGEAYIYQAAVTVEKSLLKEEELEAELEKVSDAIDKTEHQIIRIKEIAARDLDEDHAAIFDAHLLILKDPTLKSMIVELVAEEQVTAEYAVQESLRKLVAMFAEIDDEYMRERAADIKDVGSRLMRNILGIQQQSLEEMDRDVIILAHDLTPSDTATMDKKRVKGFATEIGGRTSHTAIMARSLEIPAVLGLGQMIHEVKKGDLLILDGMEGRMILNPDEGLVEEYAVKTAAYQEQTQSLKKLAKLPAVTPDGRKVEIGANIGGPGDLEGVLKYGAEGVGLYRTEFLYMDRSGLPGEDEQYEAYRAVAEKLSPNPVIIRTLDIGGDKNLPYLQLPKELNPFLGWRAIRICLDREDIFKTQLRALLRASVSKNVLIMYPMISCVSEVLAANRILEEMKAELREEGLLFDEAIRVGIMVEIPAAAITADIIVEHVDFFSIGTNDLCQYTLAVDRMNERLSHLYQPLHPAVLRLIKQVVDVSHRAGKWTGICGELAGEPEAAAILLGLGVDELSMSASSILAVKKIIRNTPYQKAREIAAAALGLKTAKEVQEYAVEQWGALNAIKAEEEG